MMTYIILICALAALAGWAALQLRLHAAGAGEHALKNGRARRY